MWSPAMYPSRGRGPRRRAPGAARQAPHLGGAEGPQGLLYGNSIASKPSGDSTKQKKQRRKKNVFFAGKIRETHLFWGAQVFPDKC